MHDISSCMKFGQCSYKRNKFPEHGDPGGSLFTQISLQSFVVGFPSMDHGISMGPLVLDAGGTGLGGVQRLLVEWNPELLCGIRASKGGGQLKFYKRFCAGPLDNFLTQAVYTGWIHNVPIGTFFVPIMDHVTVYFTMRMGVVLQTH